MFEPLNLNEYAFGIGSLIEFINAIAAVLTILFLWRYRKAKEVKYLIILELFITIWAFTYAMEFGTRDLATKIFWSKMSYLGIAFSPLSYFLFATAFSQKNKLINPTNISLLSIIPFITLPLVFTNEYHHLIWTKVELDPNINIAYYFHGPWFWVYFAYSQFMIFGGLYNLVFSIYKFTAYYKSQINILLIATFFPVLANLMYVTGLNPFPGFDWTPVSFVFTGFIVAFGIVRYRMFDLVPYARNKLFDTMDDGVILVNTEGFIEDCNAAVYRIFGLNMKSVVRKSFVFIFADYKQLTEKFSTKKNDSFILQVENKIEPKFYRVYTSPIYNQYNRFSGNLLTIHNITAEKKAEEELKQMNLQLVEEIKNKEKLIDDLDSFAHTVAHDLKNSLGTIYSSSEMLEDSIRENNTELLTELTAIVKEGAGKSMRITQELLVLATVSHQKVPKRLLRTNEIIREAKNRMPDIISEYKPEITVQQSWPKAFGHAPWIEEVWVNYLSNAIKYGGEKPEIHIGADESDDGMVRFWIKDNGDGISAEDQPKLFKKHVRLHPEKAEGYGLGLSIVKRIVEKLGGTAGVESTGKPGEGALFWFKLPVK